MSAEFLSWAQGLAARAGWKIHNARSPYSLTVIAPPNYPLNVTSSSHPMPWGTPVVTFSVPLATMEAPDPSVLLWIACCCRARRMMGDGPGCMMGITEYARAEPPRDGHHGRCPGPSARAGQGRAEALRTRETTSRSTTFRFFLAA
jgi:hypothetical protein